MWMAGLAKVLPTERKWRRDAEDVPQIMPRNLLNLLKRNLSVKLPSANTHAETLRFLAMGGGRWAECHAHS